VRVDAAGNLRGLLRSAGGDRTPRLFIGSHLDTVPGAGAFDGVLGVVLSVALVESLAGRPLPFALEVVGFSDEEGVRFGVPFIGSRALAGTLDEAVLARRDASGRSVADAMREFGLDPARLGEARASDGLGYLEFHIEQGPVLDSLGLPLGVVTAITGQSRVEVTFTGQSAHAGTTPMALRQDALAGAAAWIGRVEHDARATPDLVATVGRLDVSPGAANVVAARCRASLDVRHADDTTRRAVVERLLVAADDIASRRGLSASSETMLDQPAVPMDPRLAGRLADAVRRCGLAEHRLASGAGHDAMILAGCMPAAMLFLRSPGGISHHPDERVLAGDVEAALAVGRLVLQDLAAGSPPVE
jgi:allantoate deiminase